jgi:triacylglycerol lipase
MRLSRSRSLGYAAAACALILAACSPDLSTGPKLRGSLSAVPRNPIVFVHGWMSSSATFNTMVSRFKADGWTDAEILAFTYNSSQSNAVTAQLIKTKVDSILALTGAEKVDIITHSMGALSARYYVKYLGGDGKVDALVTLGGTNHGTVTASFCSQTSCVEMRYLSKFVNSLNSGDESWGTPRYATWWSSCDEVIYPQQSAVISGAVNTKTACMKHSQLKEDATVYAQVKSMVAQQ